MIAYITTDSPAQVKPNTNPANKSTGRFAIALFLTLSSAVALPSCAGAPTSGGSGPQMALKSSPAPLAEAASPAGSNSDAAVASKTAAAEPQASRPQLIKKAELSVIVKSIDASTKSATDIVEKRQGDIVGFQNQKPPDPSIRQTATMEIRVPQEKLDETLDALAKLGTVQNRGLTAEDVTNQLVDSEARLKNLRKSEEAVLKIMERSGSVGDVLKASQELSKIRESIELIEAQLKSLRGQVAYSTINLTLEAAVSAQQEPEPSLGLRVQETWGQATHSMGEFTLGLLALGLWLLAYSPYLLLIAAAIYGVTRWKKRHSEPPQVQEPKPPVSN
ncbi:MAG: DUF4349 domain-containing protein [Oscillatoriaceae cyanobacterium Prado104]|jgi:hypothetical protein|nr:DUF4349 domain-containing protein [Oscillatoriaceae cyanobacterium Prado104]